MTKSARDHLKIGDLESRSGVSRRTIRLYISRGLLAGPVKPGRDASYTVEHLDRLSEIKRMQGEGFTLKEISHRLAGGQKRAELSHPTLYWSYNVAEDVTVMVQSGASPWRNKHIRKALARLAAELEGAGEGGNNDTDG